MSKKTQSGVPKPRRSGYRRVFTSLLPIALLMCLLMFVLITAARNVTYTATGPSLALLDVDKSQLEHAEGEAEGKMLAEYLSGLPRWQLCATQIKILNSPTSPYFIIVEKKAAL